MQHGFRSTVISTAFTTAATAFAALIGGSLTEATAQERARSADLVGVAKAAGNFETLLAAADAAGLVGALQSDGPLTVFAPTDEAFGKLGADAIQELLLPENKTKLQEILKGHVIAGRVSSIAALQSGGGATLGGTQLEIRLEGGQLRVGDAAVVANDVQARNGVIHVIDTVLLPPERATVPADRTAAACLLLERTVEIGAPLFNEGDASACVALYENTVLALLGLSADLFDDGTKRRLQLALDDAAKEKAGKNKAWALRRGIDSAYRHLLRDTASTKPEASRREATPDRLGAAPRPAGESDSTRGRLRERRR